MIEMCKYTRKLFKYIKQLSQEYIFRWSVSLIIAFTIGILIVNYQKEKIRNDLRLQYQYLTDSLKFELRILQQYNTR